MAGFGLGLAALAIWIIVMAPQMALQAMTQRAEGISHLFLFLWFIGDCMSLFSAYAGGAVATTQYLYVWYVISGFVIDAQSLWYHFGRRRFLVAFYGHRTCRYAGISYRRKSGEAEAVTHHRASVLHEVETRVNSIMLEPPARTYFRGAYLASVFSIALAAAVVFFTFLATQAGVRLQLPSSFFTQSCERSAPEATPLFIAGQVVAYINVVFFIGSRPAQVFKNWKRKSTHGLSVSFFVLALLGDLTQALSIVLNDPPLGESLGDYLVSQIPFLLSSAGVGVFDALVLVQMFIYRGSRPEVKSSCADGEVELEVTYNEPVYTSRGRSCSATSHLAMSTEEAARFVREHRADSTVSISMSVREDEFDELEDIGEVEGREEREVPSDPSSVIELA